MDLIIYFIEDGSLPRYRKE